PHRHITGLLTPVLGSHLLTPPCSGCCDNQLNPPFMPASLLDSQFATLQPLENDEVGHVFDVTDSPAQIADAAARWLSERS
ncbi:hypothetical protein ACNQT4_11350, partial [Corynebacterium diphtheriae]